MEAARPIPEIDPATLERVRAVVSDAAGIVLGANKVSMIKSRLAKRLAATGHGDLESYLDFVTQPANVAEKDQLISAMTTNVTHFFREPHHFDRLRLHAMAAAASSSPLRVWSAGCSSGQEPYSIAMALHDAGVTRARILATDIDRAILARASAGIYSTREMEGVPSELQDRHFTTAADKRSVNASIRQMVQFKHLNLMASWPMTAPLDVIFCRNVAIYFDAETQHRLWSRMIGMLKQGGWLFIGHSERLDDSLLHAVEYDGQTSYRKISPPNTAIPNDSDGAR